MDKSKLRSLLVNPNTNLKHAMQLLNKTAEKILLVVSSDDVLLGTITDGDIRRALLNGSQFGMSVSTIMEKNFVYLQQNVSDREEAARRLMMEKKIEHVPVLDRKGVITDVLSWTDLLGGKDKKKAQVLRENLVVIMAGGKGTRLDPFTQVLPKPLMPMGDQTIIDVIMNRFYRSGFHRFVYTLNYKKEFIKLYLKEKDYPYQIEWVEETEYMGTAGGLSLIKSMVEDTFFVTNCDSLVDIDFGEVLQWHREQQAALTIIGCHAEMKVPFGVLGTSDGQLKEIYEKPTYDFIVNTGVYLIEPEVISHLPAEGGHMDMNVLIKMVNQDKKVTVFPICESWTDTGQWAEYWKSMKKLGGASIV